LIPLKIWFPAGEDIYRIGDCQSEAALIGKRGKILLGETGAPPDSGIFG